MLKEGDKGGTAFAERTAFVLPPKTLSARPLNQHIRDAYLATGLPPYVCDFLGRRLEEFVECESLLNPSLTHIPDPIAIPTMDKAVERTVRAISERERIALVCDHDMDGTASAAVLWSAIVKLFETPQECVAVFTSHRLKEGYGISDSVADRIASFRPNLVITADHGSSDEPRIAALKARGIDVLVTDHHLIPDDGPPASAVAVVNPSRSDCEYDSHICGAGVAFLLMAKVRTALVSKGLLASRVNLAGLLDFVAVATIADCVSLSPSASFINRAFIRKGLAKINSLTRPCWRIFVSFLQRNADAEAIAFRLAPAIAAAGRLDWADVGFRFLVSESDAQARSCWEELISQNEQRKKIEARLRDLAFKEAGNTADAAVILLLEDGHAGVHGITASRVVEAFGRPCGIFCPTHTDRKLHGIEDPASGSFRSVPGLDIRDVLQQIDKACPGLLIAFGGHSSAAGATIRVRDFEPFRKEFNAVVLRALDQNNLRPVLLTDGDLDPKYFTLDAVASLEALSPFGRGFEPPAFCGSFKVQSFELISNGKHARLKLQVNNGILQSIWFDWAQHVHAPLERGQEITIAYRLQANRFKGNCNLQAVIICGQLTEDASVGRDQGRSP
jgi:single-stranded-DNA-specific exonuclease